MPDLSALAQRLARHRAEMELALKEGISLDAARWRLFQQRHGMKGESRESRLWWRDQ